MKITDRSYPYPVLRKGNDDIVDSVFECNLQHTKHSIEKFHFKMTFKLENIHLQELISQNKAYFGIHVECQRTRLRKIFKMSDTTIEFDLEKKDCREKVEICTFIIANTLIANYCSEKFNEDYEGIAFRVEKGSRLALGSSFIIDVKEDDEYELSNPLFIIQKNNLPNPPSWEINTEDDLVIVSLSPDNFDKCKSMVKNNTYKEYITSSIGISVMMYLIERLREDVESDRRWAKLLRNKIEGLGLEDTDSLVVANTILEDSLTRGINFMKILMEQGEGDED